jgi:alanyl-tRNA synthetase
MGDKEVKKEFKKKAQQSPEKFYPVGALKELGFSRSKCSNCGTYFWAVDRKRTICGDSNCVGGFSFIGNSPAKKKLDYIQTWKEFARIHTKLGYTPIPRYPVVARWRTDTDFVQAGIYIFQPYVVSGEVEPVANPVVEPQVCLRFNDIDNVGITGSHYVAFVMMGEHAFQPPEKFSPQTYIRDHLTWLNQGLGLDYSELTLHEDAWAGGGNLGPSMEFFSRGLELSNQVYMQYEILPNGSYRDLKLKVLDMGQGQERVPWFTQGLSTSYETTFPTVMEKLRKVTGVKTDPAFMKQFLPYAALLNVDEVENVDLAWKKVADALKTNVAELKTRVQEQAALYSVAEHTRALLFAFHDGALPSNVGGGYNLRVIHRRVLDFMQKYGWKIDIAKLCEWHAQYLKPLFPELSENLDEVVKIFEVENGKYHAALMRARETVRKVVKGKITSDLLLQLYDSQGITPELVAEEAAKANVGVKIPDNFYARVAELHEKRAQVHETKKDEKLDIGDVAGTHALYFDDWKVPKKFTGRVVKVIGKHVLLDETWFYPTSGGQLNDLGYLGAYRVLDVFKQGQWIIHTLDVEPKFKIGDSVVGTIDSERRAQLAQHHTSTHIINAAARRVLGSHVNQASAKKTVEKGSIDITHYSRLTEEEVLAIEKEANAIVKKGIMVKKQFMPREEAEKKFGVSIYQGGVPPGKLLRIVQISGVDAEACGGTHLNNTSEASIIHIIASSKIADDIVRIEFVAGKAALAWMDGMKERGERIAGMVKKELGVAVKVSPHALQLAADVFSVSVEKLEETIAKFIAQVHENEKLLEKQKKFASASLDVFCSQLFEHWKKQNKEVDALQSKISAEQTKTLVDGSVAVLSMDMGALREIAGKFDRVMLMAKDGSFVFKGSDEKFKELIMKFGAKGGGRELRQGKVPDVKKVVGGFRF